MLAAKILIILRIIASWFPNLETSAVAVPYHYVCKITDVVLVPVRRLIPPLRFGGGMIDLSALVVLVAITLLEGFLGV